MTADDIENAMPELRRRAGYLGWLALTPPEEPLRFGVIGATQEEAIAKYRSSLAWWRAIGTDQGLPVNVETPIEMQKPRP